MTEIEELRIEELRIEELRIEKLQIEKLQIEVDKIKQMDNAALIGEFEDLLRKGAGPGFLKVIWMRKEIIRRMNRGDML